MSKKTRFEVFKRDAFTCQYCGAKAPDVVLQVDHVHPVASGGTDALINLVTSCAACNGGKGARPLDDSSAVEKQRRQLEDLQERREQIDMMVDWQRGLQNVDDHATEQLAAYWSELVPGWHLNERGKKSLRKLIRRFGIDGVMNAMRIATDDYLVLQGDPPVATQNSQNTAWSYVPRIAQVRVAEKEKPYLQRLLYIRAILRNRLNLDPREGREALEMMDRAVQAGLSLEWLEGLAKRSEYWNRWLDEMALTLDQLGVR